jgi:hypothetical protein
LLQARGKVDEHHVLSVLYRLGEQQAVRESSFPVKAYTPFFSPLLINGPVSIYIGGVHGVVQGDGFGIAGNHFTEYLKCGRVLLLCWLAGRKQDQETYKITGSGHDLKIGDSD